MPFVLTSNFPRPGNDAVAARVRDALDPGSELAWLSPAEGLSRFDEARADLHSYGLPAVRAVDRMTSAALSTGVGLLLSGGNPVVFRAELAQPPLCNWLQERLVDAPVVVAASGGAMQLTPNVSLFRLLHDDVPSVVGERNRYTALGRVPFEILPHFEHQSPAFIDRVIEYSARSNVDIWCLTDGSAVVWDQACGATAVGAARLIQRGSMVETQRGDSA